MSRVRLTSEPQTLEARPIVYTLDGIYYVAKKLKVLDKASSVIILLYHCFNFHPALVQNSNFLFLLGVF